MRKLVALACMSALAACTTVGPNYERPKGAIVNHDSAKAPFVGSKNPAFVPDEVPGDWWRLYRDPVLDGLIEDALKANTDLRVAAANIEKSRAGLDAADSARDPTTTVGAAPLLLQQRSAEEELKGKHPLPASWAYGATFGVSYQVDLFGQIRRSIESANADVASAQAAYDAVRVTVVAETTRAYLESCSAGREIAVTRQLAETQERSRAYTQRLEQGGRAVSLDVRRASTQEDQVLASLPALQARKELAVFRLATLTGRTPQEFSSPAQACVQEPRLEKPIPVGDGAALLQRRPDIRRAESDLRASTARIGVAVAELYPKVSLGASVGSVGLVKDSFESGTRKFSLGPLISWQFPNRSVTHARIRAAQADEAAAYAKFDGAVLVALRETESALVVYAQDIDARNYLESARKKSAQSASDTQRLFAAGRSGYLPVLDAMRTQIATEQAVAAADSKLAADQVAVFLALGGGWQSARPLPQ